MVELGPKNKLLVVAENLTLELKKTSLSIKTWSNTIYFYYYYLLSSSYNFNKTNC